MRRKSRSIVLLSGGLDSLVNAHRAYNDSELCLILSFDYGQRAAMREIEAASLVAKKYSVEHKKINLDWMAELDDGLTKGKIPVYDKNKLDDIHYALNTAKQVWVPNRNGVMINIAASFAEAMDVDLIIVGFNREEAASFPDNSSDFIKYANASLEFSTLKKPRIRCYTMEMDKNEIVKHGIEISAPFEYLWSCYHDADIMCGECESCRRLKRALIENNFLEKFNEINKWGIK